MTNEEKIKEIAEKEVHPIIAERCALEMAEWKDQQFKEYLKKKKEELEHKVVYGSGGYYTKQIDIVNEIINELFGETENVDYSNNDE